MESKIFHYTQQKINASFENQKLNKKDINYKKSEIDYKDFENEISKLVKYTKNEWFIDNHFYSFFCFSPTGNAKTSIVEQMAKKEEVVFHKLELQKVPIEILQGFPYLEETNINGQKMMIAKLAPSTILPPPNDPRTWILHLDEFNKADTEKMSAVMNLVLTGELGGSADYNSNGNKSIKYTLPRKTIILGTGNTKTQDNVENLNVVNSMDTATSERWHRSANMPYNADAWLQNFATKKYNFLNEELETRIPSIILNYILDKRLDVGKKEAPFLIPVITGSEDGMETERTTSPRAWTLASDMMFLEMYDFYMNMNNKQRKPYEELAGDGSGFNEFVKNPNTQIHFLNNQVFEFGIKGHELIQDIIARYIYFAENRVLPEDIIFNYVNVREKIKKLIQKRGVILHLIFGIAYYLDEVKTIKDHKNAAISISTYIEDTDIPEEDLTAFIQTLEKSENENAKEIHELLGNISKRYKSAYSNYYYINQKEI